MKKIVKTITVGSLKNKLNESKGHFALGQGFGSEARFKSNVQDSDYNRKFDNKGGFGLGQGFTKLNEEEMVDFITNIVESMKGKTEYHNLKFVDRIGNENGLFESQIKNIKNIIKSDRTPYQLKLRKYLTENVAEEMSGIYEGYDGLMHEGEMMVNEIKSTFNEMKYMGKTTDEAVTMTAEALDVPMEMVDKMVQVQKEAYKARMEGMGETMDINEKLCEVYESYKNMAEGNMKPVYEELKEMMNPEPEEPPYGSLEGEKGYEGYKGYGSSEEDEEDPDAYKRDYEDIERQNPLEEESCMECGDTDEDSYIEVELSSPKDFALLRMLAKGAMSTGRMPSMGMSKMSRDMNTSTEKDCQDYEVPMDYSTSNPYNQYKFDTGLSKVPYGKKKISSLEGDEDSNVKVVTFNESLIRQHMHNTQTLDKKQIKFIIESFKIRKVSKCRNFILVENKVFDIKNKIFLSENHLLTESIAWTDALLMLEREKQKISRGTWWANLAQNLVSVGSVAANIFVPGSGAAIEFTNGLIYMLRGFYTEDNPDLQNSLFLNGGITIGFVLLGAGFGGGFSAILKTMISSGKVAAPAVAKALVWLLPKVGLLFKRILNAVTFTLSNRLFRLIARFIPALAKGAEKLKGKEFNKHIIKVVSDKLVIIQARLTAYINKILAQGGKDALKATGKETVKQTAKTLGKLAGKEGFDAFITGAAKAIPKILPNKAGALLAKLGIKNGGTIIIKGIKYTIKITKGKVNLASAVSGSKGINVSPAVLINAYMRTKGFMGFVRKVFSNPSASVLSARFLNGFIFGKDGTLEDANLEEMPDGVIDMSAVDIELEGGEYGGDTGQYTANDTVTVVQTALDKLGENLGGTGIDGKYGPVTRGAINNVEDAVGMPKTTGNITAQSVIAISIALVEKNKIPDAKELAAAIQDSEILNNVNDILNNSSTSNEDKITALKGASSGKSSGKSGFFDRALATAKGTTVSEETFSENYKRMFGLTLD
jgi:hypothetical protein